MIRTKEEYLQMLKDKIGDSTEDKDLQLIEDFTDTFDKFSQPNLDETDWKQKYEDNDKQWRERYKARFFAAATPEPEFGKTAGELTDEEKETEKAESITIDDLFK